MDSPRTAPWSRRRAALALGVRPRRSDGDAGGKARSARPMAIWMWPSTDKAILRVTLPSGVSAYTRDGSLKRSAEGRSSPRTAIRWSRHHHPEDARSIAINANGEVFAYFNDRVEPENLGQITLANFVNEKGLERRSGSNLFLETTASGAHRSPAWRRGPGHHPRRLSMRKARSIRCEVAELIKAQRGYELNSKVITAADQMLGTTVQVRLMKPGPCPCRPAPARRRSGRPQSRHVPAGSPSCRRPTVLEGEGAPERRVRGAAAAGHCRRQAGVGSSAVPILAPQLSAQTRWWEPGRCENRPLSIEDRGLRPVRRQRRPDHPRDEHRLARDGFGARCAGRNGRRRTILKERKMPRISRPAFRTAILTMSIMLTMSACGPVDPDRPSPVHRTDRQPRTGHERFRLWHGRIAQPPDSAASLWTTAQNSLVGIAGRQAVAIS